MKTFRIVLIAILVQGVSHGAGIAPSVDTIGHKPCFDLTTSPPSEEDTAAFRRILDVVPVDPDTISLYVSRDPMMKNYDGAISFACETPNHKIYETYDRWTIYDPDLMQGDAARDFAFAHEIAHHVESQTLSGPRTEKEELQADYYGAKYLLRLGWTKARLLYALDLLNLPQGSHPGYPTLAERKAEVEKAAAPDGPSPPMDLQGAVVADSPPPDEELFKKLLDFTYQGPIRFQSLTTNKYVCARGTPNPKLPSTKSFVFFDNCERDIDSLFVLYKRSPYGTFVYWISQNANPCPDYAANCERALESVGHQLQFWNQDLAADPNGWQRELGDQDLFSFEASDQTEGLVRIKAYKEGYIFVDPKTEKLESGASQEQATEFRVLFDLNPNQN